MKSSCLRKSGYNNHTKKLHVVTECATLNFKDDLFFVLDLCGIQVVKIENESQTEEKMLQIGDILDCLIRIHIKGPCDQWLGSSTRTGNVVGWWFMAKTT